MIVLTSFYEVASYLIGDVPHQFEFVIPIVAVVLTLLVIAACVGFLLLPLQFFKR